MRLKENVDEFYLISDGAVDLLYTDPEQPDDKQVFMEVLSLPTYSYFGDFQILLNLRSMFVYMSNDRSETTTMCLGREKFKELLEQYPNVHEHWLKMAKIRRREFRRLAFQAKEALSLKVEPNPEDSDDMPELTYIRGKKLKRLRDYTRYLDEKGYSDEVLDRHDDCEQNEDKTKRKKNTATKKVNKGIDSILEFGFDEYGRTLGDL